MNLHDKTMKLLIEKLELSSTDKEYKKFEQLITVVNVAYLKTAIYTFHTHSKKENFYVTSKFDYLMSLYNQLLREHQVMFLLFNIFETAIRSKAAYELSKKYSSPDTDDWLHNEEQIPQKIKTKLDKAKEYIGNDVEAFDKLSSFEIFDYIMLGNLRLIYFDFWDDLKHLFESKIYKGNQLQEIGRNRLKDMLEEIRKARNDNAHHKPFHKRRKKRYKLIEDIENILLHIGFNLDEAINNIDPEHKIIKIGYYENASKVKKLLENPSKKNLKEIQKLCQYKGIDSYFQRELLKSDLIAWYDVFKTLDYFKKCNFPSPNQNNQLDFFGYLNFLELISKSFEDEKYKDFEIEFINIVNEIIDYFDEISSNGILIHLHNDWILFKIIQNFSFRNININHIKFIEQGIKRSTPHSLIASELKKLFLEKVLQCEDEIVVEFYKTLFSYSISDEKFSNKFESLVESHWLKEIVSESLKLLIPTQTILIRDLLLRELQKMYEEKNFEFSTHSIASIEQSEQRRDYDANIATILVDFIRDLFEIQMATNIVNNVKVMLTSESSIIKRLAIHLINKFFIEMKDLFFEYENNFLDDSELLHEIFLFFKQHVDDFSPNEINKIVYLIENQDLSYLSELEDDKEYGEIRKAYRKRKYLYPLKDSRKYPQLLVLFNKYNSLLENEDEHPAFDSYIGNTRLSKTASPLSTDEIQKKSTKELVQYVKHEFQEEQEKFDRPTHRSLASEISLIILQEPDYYINKLDDLAQLGEEYFYTIVDAYKQSLQKQEIDSKKVLKFILLFITIHKNDRNFNHWYISNPISNFIKELSSSERNHVLNDELQQLILEVLIHTDTFINDYEEKDEITDYISHMLNAPKGQLYSAMVEYSLKHARDYNLEDNRWIEEIKSLFSHKLNKDKSIDLYSVIGVYLHNIMYLDYEWLRDDFEFIFGTEVNDKLWEASLSGYLYNSSVDLSIYNDMLNIGALDKALSFAFRKKEYSNKFVQFICVSYTSEKETLEDETSMISKLIDIGTIQQIEELVRFFQSRTNEQSFDTQKILKPLWKKLFIQVTQKKYTKLHVELIQLMSSVDAIDKEIYELLIESISELEKFDGYTPWVTDNLARLLENSTKYVADIYIALLKKFHFHSYEKDIDKKIVEYLYKNDFKNEANKICNLYGEYGDNSLEEVYNEYIKL